MLCVRVPNGEVGGMFESHFLHVDVRGIPPLRVREPLARREGERCMKGGFLGLDELMEVFHLLPHLLPGCSLERTSNQLCPILSENVPSGAAEPGTLGDVADHDERSRAMRASRAASSCSITCTVR